MEMSDNQMDKFIGFALQENHSKEDEELTRAILAMMRHGESIQKVSYDDKDGLKAEIIDSKDFYKPPSGGQ